MRLVLNPGCTIDLDRRRVERDGFVLGLTDREVSLLRYLAHRLGQDVSLTELHEEAGGTARRLREKLEPDPADPRHLVTVHGVGYRLFADAVVPEEAPAAAPTGAGLVGREAELRELRLLLDQHGLATLAGPPGIGKTRLARELCNEQEGLWIDLGAATDPAGIHRAVARALRIPLGEDPVKQLAGALKALGAALVVLDDAGPEARHAVERWSRAAPAVRWVVTSRQRLGLLGEAVLDVDPLQQDEAVQLFLRACRAPSVVSRPVLVALAEALDGVPLALELAAARIGRVDPEGLLERLSERLQGHDALSATLAWSWALLSDTERAALSQCSLFRAPFRMVAAEAVLALPDTSGILQDLVDARLLFHAPATDTPRLAMFRVVRSWAREQLADPEASLRHARFFAGWGSPDFVRDVELSDPLRAREQRLAEHDELVAGLQVALQAREAETSLALARALTTATTTSGPSLAAEPWVHRALALAGEDPELARARFNTRIAWASALDRGQRRDEARHLLQLARPDASDGFQRSEADLVEASLLWHRGEPDAARRVAQRGLEQATMHRIPRHQVHQLMLLAGLDRADGQLAEARVRLERVVRLPPPDPELGSRAHLALGRVHQLVGHHAEALHHVLEALRLAREVGDTALEARAWQAVGAVHASRGDRDRATDAFDQAARCLTRLGLDPERVREVGRLVEAP